MRLFRTRRALTLAGAVLAVFVTVAVAAGSAMAHNTGRWVSGDMHTHTFLTDGSNTEAQVAQKAFGTYGLDWFANSEHGGFSSRDPFGNAVSPSQPRWWSLRNWSYPVIRDLRPLFPGNTLIQGLEWNAPTHEHVSVGIVSNEPSAVAEFEYRFDKGDTSSNWPDPAVVKTNKTAADTLAGIAWLQARYADSAYVVLNHPSRALSYSAADIRDFLAAGPGVVAGFEGIPGHQREADRGGYGSTNPAARCYQGVDAWAAKIGGVWDSILANGTPFSIFSNSDFHSTAGDFWPGEYQKNWTFADNPHDPKSIVAGLKSGRAFGVQGDLIDGLEFTAESGGEKVAMGDAPIVVRRGRDVVVNVKFHSPKRNNNADSPKVDHVDLIAGSVTGPAVKGTASWDATTNPTARVVRTFGARSIRNLGHGYFSATYVLHDVQGPMYMRLRGTNLPENAPGKTDANGNPLVDQPGANSAANAWGSLWFYSNPVWIGVR